MCMRARAHTHTHTHARCYQGEGRIMEDGDSHLETILTNIDQHHQQIRLGWEYP